MPRRRYRKPPSAKIAVELARLGFEAWSVISLRMAKLGMGGPAAVLEGQRMIVEKAAAALEAQAAAGLAAATGIGNTAIMRKAIGPYRRRVRANRRRLKSKI